ncbi:MAG: SMC-Scp complex subunit ScpB [Bradymonadia bacterium]
MSAPVDDLHAALEALLFAADHPLSAKEISTLFSAAAQEEEWPGPVAEAAVVKALKTLAEQLSGRGIELIQVDQKWRLRTRPVLAPIVRRLWPGRPTRLSKAALEVLAIVAYRQPCTRIDIESIRGVDCGGVLRSLLDRKLVRIAGKLDEPGRPLTYATSPTFLEVFGLTDLKALPTLRDLESLQAEAEARRKGSAPNVEAARAAKRAPVPPKPVTRSEEIQADAEVEGEPAELESSESELSYTETSYTETFDTETFDTETFDTGPSEAEGAGGLLGDGGDGVDH